MTQAQLKGRLNADGLPELSVDELKQCLDQVKIIDVRRPDEFKGELGHIKGAELITLETDLETKLSNLPKDPTYVFVCRSGGRSNVATAMAQSKGLTKIFNMAGGMIAWNNQGYPVERN